MTAPDPADTVTEQVAEVLSAHRISVGDFIDGLEWDDMPDPWQDECRDAARALADAGLLADPAALEAAHRKGFYEGADSVIREELADPADQDEPDWQAIADQAEQDMAHWVRECGDAERRAERAEATVQHITELAFEHNGCSGCQTPWWLRQALGSDFTRSLTLSPAEQVEALTTRAERAEAKLAQTEVALGDAMAAEVAELRATVEKVREIHQQHACTGYPDCMILFGGQCAHHGHCNHCRKTWPCPTIDALDGGGQQ